MASLQVGVVSLPSSGSRLFVLARSRRCRWSARRPFLSEKGEALGGRLRARLHGNPHLHFSLHVHSLFVTCCVERRLENSHSAVHRRREQETRLEKVPHAASVASLCRLVSTAGLKRCTSRVGTRLPSSSFPRAVLSPLSSRARSDLLLAQCAPFALASLALPPGKPLTCSHAQKRETTPIDLDSRQPARGAR